MVFLPFLNSITELPKVMFFRIFTLITFGLIFYQSIKTAKFNWIKIDKKLWIYFSIFIFVNLLSAYFSINPHLSFWGSYERQQGLLQFTYYVIFFLLFVSFFDKKSINKLIKFLSYASVIIAMFAILQNFIPAFTSFWNTDNLIGRLAIGTLGHPNFLASYLLMALPFVLINFFSPPLTGNVF